MTSRTFAKVQSFAAALNFTIWQMNP